MDTGDSLDPPDRAVSADALCGVYLNIIALHMHRLLERPASKHSTNSFRTPCLWRIVPRCRAFYSAQHKHNCSSTISVVSYDRPGFLPFLSSLYLVPQTTLSRRHPCVYPAPKISPQELQPSDRDPVGRLAIRVTLKNIKYC